MEGESMMKVHTMLSKVLYPNLFNYYSQGIVELKIIERNYRNVKVRKPGSGN